MKLFHPLLALIASATNSELARQVRYLKEKNRILRDRIKGEIHTTLAERRRLLKFGHKLGKSIYGLITIVTPGTFRRWLREEKDGKQPKPTGRPRKNQVLRELVKKIAVETGYGCTRIVGELRKLGFSRICRETVRQIIREEGIEPSPQRSQRTWDQFVKSHAETLWGCDFFSVRSITKKGIVNLYAMVFVHFDSRRAIVSPTTLHPDSAWVTKQTRDFLAQVPRGEGQKLYLVRDRDTKFSRQFREALVTQNVKTVKLPIASPNLNARVERFIQTLKYECLHHFILFGQRHVDYLVDEFVDYYNRERAHSSLGFRPPAQDEPPEANEDASLDGIVRRDRLGGIVKYYERRAA